jgi:hypothetical protein
VNWAGPTGRRSAPVPPRYGSIRRTGRRGKRVRFVFAKAADRRCRASSAGGVAQTALGSSLPVTPCKGMEFATILCTLMNFPAQSLRYAAQQRLPVVWNETRDADAVTAFSDGMNWGIGNPAEERRGGIFRGVRRWRRSGPVSASRNAFRRPEVQRSLSLRSYFGSFPVLGMSITVGGSSHQSETITSDQSTNPPTSPLLNKKRGVCRSGGRDCRSRVEVSKRRVEPAVSLAFASREGCRTCRSAAAARVEVRVEALSKQANFDTETGSYLVLSDQPLGSMRQPRARGLAVGGTRCRSIATMPLISS